MKARLSYRQDKRLTIVLFLVLPLVLFLFFFIYPLGYTVYLSLHEWDGFSPTMESAGIRNYVSVIQNSQFIAALINNTQLLIFYVLVPPAIGLIIALLIDRGVKGQGFFQTIYYLPCAINAVAVGTIWRWIYNPGYGLLNQVLKVVGLGNWTQNWLGAPQIAIFSIMMSSTWISVGTPFILYLAGLQTVPRYLLDAAKIDGASSYKVFRHIVWPLLTPTTVIVEALAALRAIRLFDLVYALTDGRPSYFNNVLSVHMFETSFKVMKMGEGSAIAIVLVIIAAAIISPYLVYSMKKIEKMQQ